MHIRSLALVTVAALWLWPATLRAQSEALTEAYRRGMELYEAGRYEQATPFLREAAELSEREFGPDDPTTARVLNNLAELYRATGRYADAEPLHRRALAISEAALGPEHSDTAQSLNNLAALYWATGRYAAAEPLYQRALAIFEKTFGPDHPEVAGVASNLAALYEATGRYAAAEPLFRRALAIDEAALGPEHPSVATDLNNLALLYRATGRYAAAEPLYRRALAIDEKALGPEHPGLAIDLTNLAALYEATGRYAAAEPLFRRALAIDEKALGPDHPDVAAVASNLASFYHYTGRYAAAERLHRRALAIDEAALGPEHPTVATRLNNLAELHRATGRYAEAERLYRRALAISELALGPEHPTVATRLNNLAELYRASGRYAAVEPLFRRALAISEKTLGPEHPHTALSLNNLAGLYQATGRYGEAEPLFRRALAIYEKTPGPERPELASSLNNIALLHRATGRYGEAEPLHRRALAIREKALGPEHPSVATDLNNLAGLYRATRRHAAAKRLYRRALAISEAALGPEHPELAVALSNLAWLYREQGQHREALAHIKKATAISRGRAVRSSTGRSIGAQAELAAAQHRFRGHAAIAAEYAEERPEQRTALAAEAFAAGQLARATGTANAVSRMAARFAAGSDALARAVREQQDLVARSRAFDAALIEAVSRPPEERARDAEERLRRELDAVGRRLDELDARVARDFPAYAGLMSPEPLPVPDLQALLAPDEALVAFLIGSEQSYAWVMRPADLELLVLPAGRDELAADVAHLRLGLDPAAGRGVPQLEMAAEGLRGAERLEDGRSVVGLFDVDRAHALYQKVWAPLEPYLEGVARVVVVPDGPLESLPLQVLVTESPNRELEGREELRGVAWLAKRPYALNVLPAVGALRALRELAPNTPPGGAAFLGFGDPLIGGAPAADCREPAPEELVVAELTAEAESWPRRGVEAGPADLFRGGSWRDGVPVADAAAVRRLPRLPDSRCELQALARSLGTGEDALYLGAAATEAAVKGLSAAGELRMAGVLAFATHGLVAGELDGLAEPALVLTPPAAGTAEDDGLLTAGEVAQLDLNAEWVLLSACNTAAADGTPGAEGLSGLARAFFYAGARALLVSHWSVYSPAAVALTTGTLEALRQEPGLGRAEALRRTMVDLIERGSNPHPAYWAPFVVVGEGGAS